MAQHDIRIKATLDTSQMQAQLDGMNRQRQAEAGQAGVQGQQTRPDARSFDRMDATLKQLNRTLQDLAQQLRQAFGLQSRSQTVVTEGGGMVAPASHVSWQGFKFNRPKFDPVQYQPRLATFDPNELGNESEKQKLLNEALKEYDKDMARYRESLKEGESARRDIAASLRMRNRLRYGAATHVVGQAVGSLSEFLPSQDQAQLGIASSAMQAAGMGAMVHPLLGAFAGLASAVGGVAREMKNLEATSAALRSAFSQFQANREIQLGAERLETRFAGPLTKEEREHIRSQSQEQLRVYTMSREAYARNIETMHERYRPGEEYGEEFAKELERHQQGYKEAQRKIDAAKQTLRQLAQEDEKYADERAAYYAESARNQRRYKDAIKRYEDNEYQQRMEHYQRSTQNVQANRAALKAFEDRMAARDHQVSMLNLQMQQQADAAAIQGGWYKGADRQTLLQNAKTERAGIRSLIDKISSTTDDRQLRRLNMQLEIARTRFSDYMQLADLLKPNGEPLQRVNLENLTSLASRGGWMGERNNTTQYFDRLDKQIDLLRNIDENTRKEEQSIWQ